MAKKTRRTTTSVSMASSSARGTEFNPDYTYIKRDLTHIGALAGFFFLALVVLSFFLR